MSPNAIAQEPDKRRHFGDFLRGRGMLRVIAIFKLIKAAAVLITTAVFARLLRGDGAQRLAKWAQELQSDPHSRYLRLLIQKVSGLDREKVHALEVAALFYAALFMVEGIGLLLGKRWAEYMTVIATSTLIPLELYEIYEHRTGTKVAVLIINVAIVIYLIWYIRKTGKRHSDHDAQAASHAPA